MRGLLKRLRGAFGLALLGAGGLTLYAAIDVMIQSLSAGIWPSLPTVLRIVTFTTSVGGLVGLLTAGAIAIGARSQAWISKTRAFTLGLPVGAIGGFAYVTLAADLPLSGSLMNAALFGLGAGGMGAAVVAIAERSPDAGQLELDSQAGEIGPEGSGPAALLGGR